MSDLIKPEDIDAIIHEPVRLAIVSALAVAPELSFNELKSTLGLSDGNLSAHSRSLQEAGYIVIKKTFEGRRPHTIMRLTGPGYEAFRSYIETLRKVIEKGGKAVNEAEKQRDL